MKVFQVFQYSSRHLLVLFFYLLEIVLLFII